VVTVWRWSHVKVPFDELVSRASLRQIFVMLYGERRRFRSNDHGPSISRVGDASSGHCRRNNPRLSRSARVTSAARFGRSLSLPTLSVALWLERRCYFRSISRIRSRVVSFWRFRSAWIRWNSLSGLNRSSPGSFGPNTGSGNPPLANRSLRCR
jgi:hypothetical protein